MALTMKDIARLSGVGLSTVSRVLNNSAPTSEKTRKRVLDIVQQYNYIPNNSARNLKKSNSKSVALLVKGIMNPFFNKMVRVIERNVAIRGYSLFIQNVESSSDELDVAIQEARDRNLCGVILMGGSFTYTQAKFEQLGIPCVLLTISADSSVDAGVYSSVKIDDEKEAYKITKYLIEQGHRHIGFIHRVAAADNNPNSLRFQGYLRALEEHGLPVDYDLIADLASDSDSGYHFGFQCFRQIYMKNKFVSAVFAYSDVLAIGAAKAALTLGLRIPEDISIVGFDGIELSEIYHPSIDTAYQPGNEMALSSVEILFDMMQGGNSKHLVYETVLLKRGSSCFKK